MRASWVIVVVLGVASVAAAEPAAPALDDARWTSAEASVRAALAGDKNPIKELRRLSWLHLPAFGVTRGDDAAHYAVVSGGTVRLSTAKHSDKQVTCVLKAEHALDRRVLAAADVVFLVHALGEAPAAIRDALDHQTTGRGTIAGHDPTLTWSGTGAATKASLIVWAAQPPRHHAGAEPTPMLHLQKATLTIAPSYALTWKITSVDEPDTATP